MELSLKKESLTSAEVTIYCPKKEQFVQCLEYAEEKKFRWCSGDLPLQCVDYYSKYNEETRLHFVITYRAEKTQRLLSFGDHDCYNDQTIISFEEFKSTYINKNKDIKIQINSLEAIQRLIGEDKELEIAVKESIINQFTKKYLKSAINNEAVKKLKQEILQEIEETGYFGMFENSFLYSKTLTDKARDLVESATRRETDDLIVEVVNSQKEEIKESIKTKTDFFIKSEIISVKRYLINEQREAIREEIRNILSSLK